jgi:hypothetical protein
MNIIYFGDVMKEEMFLYFENPNSFSVFLKKFNVLNDWKITSGTMNERGTYISNKWYSNYLKNKFNSKSFFRRSVSISEIVSWLDSFIIMKRVFDSLILQVEQKEYERIEIYCEYVIQMSKMMRVDYIIKYNDIILLLEFRLVNDFEKIKTTWTKKKTELLIYKELCENYFDKEYKILTFAFISLYEHEMNIPNQAHIDYNNNQVDFLCKYIKKFMINRIS